MPFAIPHPVVPFPFDRPDLRTAFAQRPAILLSVRPDGIALGNQEMLLESDSSVRHRQPFTDVLRRSRRNDRELSSAERVRTAP